MARTPSGELFPTDAPLPPGDLIGRDEPVRSLAEQLAGHTHRIVTGPRRTGKTSVCRAALEQLRRRGSYVVALDLFGLGALSEVAEAMATAAVVNRSGVRQLLARARRTGRTVAAAATTSVTARLQSELGEEVEIAFRPGLAARDPQRYFTWSLRLLQRIAEADDRRLVLFIDEFQELAADRHPYGDPDSLTKRMRSELQGADRVTCLFAGSVEHLMQDLFTPRRRAFYRFGGFFPLPPILPEEWHAGLADRFARDGCTLTPDALERVVILGEGHPRVTMLIAQQTHAASLAAETTRVDTGLVHQGLTLALAADAASLDGDVERIRRLGRHTLLLARRVARGERPYEGTATSSSTARALHALRDAGFVEQERRGLWHLTDPLLRRHLAEVP